MRTANLTRRSSLLLPFALAACGGGEKRTNFPPFRYDYYAPIDLNVRTIDVDVRYKPARDKTDVAYLSPADPIATLRQIGEERIKPLGGQGKAVFAIVDAGLTQRGDTIRGAMEATLELYGDSGESVGYVQARSDRKHTGDADDLRAILYDMVSAMKDDINLELEHQIRTKMKDWIIEGVSATPGQVESAPLAAPHRK